MKVWTKIRTWLLLLAICQVAVISAMTLPPRFSGSLALKYAENQRPEPICQSQSTISQNDFYILNDITLLTINDVNFLLWNDHGCRSSSVFKTYETAIKSDASLPTSYKTEKNKKNYYIFDSIIPVMDNYDYNVVLRWKLADPNGNVVSPGQYSYTITPSEIRKYSTPPFLATPDYRYSPRIMNDKSKTLKLEFNPNNHMTYLAYAIQIFPCRGANFDNDILTNNHTPLREWFKNLPKSFNFDEQAVKLLFQIQDGGNFDTELLRIGYNDRFSSRNVFEFIFDHCPEMVDSWRALFSFNQMNERYLLDPSKLAPNTNLGAMMEYATQPITDPSGKPFLVGKGDIIQAGTAYNPPKDFWLKNNQSVFEEKEFIHVSSIFGLSNKVRAAHDPIIMDYLPPYSYISNPLDGLAIHFSYPMAYPQISFGNFNSSENHQLGTASQVLEGIIEWSEPLSNFGGMCHLQVKLENDAFWESHTFLKPGKFYIDFSRGLIYDEYDRKFMEILEDAFKFDDEALFSGDGADPYTMTHSSPNPILDPFITIEKNRLKYESLRQTYFSNFTFDNLADTYPDMRITLEELERKTNEIYSAMYGVNYPIEEPWLMRPEVFQKLLQLSVIYEVSLEKNQNTTNPMFTKGPIYLNHNSLNNNLIFKLICSDGLTTAHKTKFEGNNYNASDEFMKYPIPMSKNMTISTNSGDTFVDIIFSQLPFEEMHVELTEVNSFTNTSPRVFIIPSNYNNTVYKVNGLSSGKTYELKVSHKVFRFNNGILENKASVLFTKNLSTNIQLPDTFLVLHEIPNIGSAGDVFPLDYKIEWQPPANTTTPMSYSITIVTNYGEMFEVPTVPSGFKLGYSRPDKTLKIHNTIKNLDPNATLVYAHIFISGQTVITNATDVNDAPNDYCVNNNLNCLDEKVHFNFWPGHWETTDQPEFGYIPKNTTSGIITIKCPDSDTSCAGLDAIWGVCGDSTKLADFGQFEIGGQNKMWQNSPFDFKTPYPIYDLTPGVDFGCKLHMRNNKFVSQTREISGLKSDDTWTPPSVTDISLQIKKTQGATYANGDDRTIAPINLHMFEVEHEYLANANIYSIVKDIKGVFSIKVDNFQRFAIPNLVPCCDDNPGMQSEQDYLDTLFYDFEKILSHYDKKFIIRDKEDSNAGYVNFWSSQAIHRLDFARYASFDVTITFGTSDSSLTQISDSVIFSKKFFTANVMERDDIWKHRYEATADSLSLIIDSQQLDGNLYHHLFRNCGEASIVDNNGNIKHIGTVTPVFGYYNNKDCITGFELPNHYYQSNDDFTFTTYIRLWLDRKKCETTLSTNKFSSVASLSDEEKIIINEIPIYHTQVLGAVTFNENVTNNDMSQFNVEWTPDLSGGIYDGDILYAYIIEDTDGAFIARGYNKLPRLSRDTHDLWFSSYEDNLTNGQQIVVKVSAMHEPTGYYNFTGQDTIEYVWNQLEVTIVKGPVISVALEVEFTINMRIHTDILLKTFEIDGWLLSNKGDFNSSEVALTGRDDNIYEYGSFNFDTNGYYDAVLYNSNFDATASNEQLETFPMSFVYTLTTETDGSEFKDSLYECEEAWKSSDNSFSRSVMVDFSERYPINNMEQVKIDLLTTQINITYTAYYNISSMVANSLDRARLFCERKHKMLAIFNHESEIIPFASELYNNKCYGHYIHDSYYGFLDNRFTRPTDENTDYRSERRMKITRPDKDRIMEGETIDFTDYLSYSDMDESDYSHGPIICEDVDDTKANPIRIEEDCCCESRTNCKQHYYDIQESRNIYIDKLCDPNDINQQSKICVLKQNVNKYNTNTGLRVVGDLLYYVPIGVTTSFQGEPLLDASFWSNYRLVYFDSPYEFKDASSYKGTEISDLILDPSQTSVTYPIDLHDLFTSRISANRAYYLAICPAGQSNQIRCVQSRRVGYHYLSQRPQSLSTDQTTTTAVNSEGTTTDNTSTANGATQGGHTTSGHTTAGQTTAPHTTQGVTTPAVLESLQIKTNNDETHFYKYEEIEIFIKKSGNLTDFFFSCNTSPLRSCFPNSIFGLNNIISLDFVSGENNMTLKLSADELEDGKNYDLEVCMKISSSNNNDTLCDQITIDYRSSPRDTFPSIEIICIKNCFPMYDFNSLGHFRFTCQNCPEDTDFQLSGYPENTEEISSDVYSDFDKDLVIQPGILQAGDVYTIVLRMQADSFPSTIDLPLKEEISLISNSPPSGGSCQIVHNNVTDISYTYVHDVLGRSGKDATQYITINEPGLDEFTKNHCEMKCKKDGPGNYCDYFKISGDKKTCSIYYESSTNSDSNDNFKGISSRYKTDNKNYKIYQKTHLAVEPILGQFGFACQNWTGSSSTLYYKANIVIPEENQNENDIIQPDSNNRLNLVESDSEHFSAVTVPMLNDLNTTAIEFEVCDEFRFCTSQKELFHVTLVAPSEEAIETELDHLIEKLSNGTTPSTPKEIVKTANMVMSNENFSEEKKEKLAVSVVDNIMSAGGLSNMPDTEILSILNTVALVSDKLTNETAQDTIQDDVNNSIAHLSTAALTAEEKDKAFKSITGIGSTVAKKAKPQDEALAESMSGVGQSLADMNQQDKSEDELIFESNEKVKTLFKDIREKQNRTNSVLVKTRDINKKISEQLSKEIIGANNFAKLKNKDTTVAASNGLSEGETLNLDEFSLSGKMAELPMSVSKSGNGLVVKKRDVNIKNVIDIKPDCNNRKVRNSQSLTESCGKGMGSPIGLSIKQDDKIKNDHNRRKRDARERSIRNAQNTPITTPSNLIIGEEKKLNLDAIPSQLGNNATHFTGSMALSEFRINTKGSGVVLVIEPYDAFKAVGIEVFIRANAKPTIEDYDLNYKLPYDLDVWNMEEEYDNWKIFISTEQVELLAKTLYGQSKDQIELGDRFYVGIIRSSSDFDVTVTVVTPSCKTFNEELQTWEGDNCVLGDQTNLVDVHCDCLIAPDKDPSDGLIIGTEFFSPPNTIDFSSVFQKFDVSDNPAVFATIISFFGIYVIILLCGTLHWDRRDQNKWRVRQLYDNYLYPENRSVLYQVTISTGAMPYSGTESLVSFKLFALNENIKLRTRQLKDSANKLIKFDRGTVKNFLMREKNVSAFSHIHVWHDNSNGDWNCDTIIIKNLNTNESHFFYVRDWLSVDKGTFMVDKTIPSASNEDDTFNSFSDLFKAGLWLKLMDDHLWISVFYRGCKSNFNRTQRWTCCFLLVFITFVANCMWFETGSKQNPIFSIGPIEMTASQLWSSIAAALVAIPPITFVIIMFQRTESSEEAKHKARMGEISPGSGSRPGSRPGTANSRIGVTRPNLHRGRSVTSIKTMNSIMQGS